MQQHSMKVFKAALTSAQWTRPARGKYVEEKAALLAGIQSPSWDWCCSIRSV
jgi:hypothetical protein